MILIIISAMTENIKPIIPSYNLVFQQKTFLFSGCAGNGFLEMRTYGSCILGVSSKPIIQRPTPIKKIILSIGSLIIQSCIIK